MRKAYHGVIPPIITPVDARENVDEEGFRALLEDGIARGLHGVFVAGTNGECMALTQAERNRAIRIAVDQANGRVPVLAGVMDSSTRRVIENIKALEGVGVRCAVVTSIFYARHTSQEETIRHFEQISQETDVDLMVYNMPSMTGLTLSPATVLRLAQLDRVKGYKDSSPAFGAFLQILAQLRDTPFACLQGITQQAMSALLMGADGFVPALAPLFPELYVEAYEAGVSGDVRKARVYDRLLAETTALMTMTANATAAVKYALSTLGFTDKRVIAPQDGIRLEEEAAMNRQIERVRTLYDQVRKGLDPWN